ncbi:MAG: HAMP domain-containing protein [Candidatus Hydrogenedentes bacterium]|nr:HAMP domain-containing protein [Candidatus Hydrogenedentota bacterium]
MKPLSFRVRIALLSVVISGLVLAAFGVWALLLAERTELKRIDDDLRGFAAGHVGFRRPPHYWQRVGESLQFVFGSGHDDALILLVKGPNGEELYRSRGWPETLPISRIPSPDELPRGPEGEPPPPIDPMRWRLGPPPVGGPPEPDAPLIDGNVGRIDEKMPVDAGNEDVMTPRGPRRRGGGRGMGPGRPPGPPAGIQRRPEQFFTESDGRMQWRIAVFGDPDATLALGLNLGPHLGHIHRTRIAFLVAYIAALLVVGAGGWLISDRALRPVKILARTAEQITAQDLSQRMDVRKEDAEFFRLASVLNAMLDRLEKSYQQAVRFSADASHELKTPLTILQGELEQALQGSPPGSPQQQLFSQLLGEVQRLKAITRKLLLLSLADAGRLTLHLEPVSLSDAVDSLCDDCQILAPGLTVERDIMPDLWVNADADLLTQVLQNISSNAIKYNKEGGWIRVRLDGDASTVRLDIANAGKGIVPEDRDKVFDRFYRGEKSRDRSVDGVGLGLSLAREIVRAHKGTLVLSPDTTDECTVFTMTLPAVQNPRRVSTQGTT